MPRGQDLLKFNRREARFLSAAVRIGIALTRHANASDDGMMASHRTPGNCTTPPSAIANMQYGWGSGILDGSVFTFGNPLWITCCRRKTMDDRKAPNSLSIPNNVVTTAQLKHELKAAFAYTHDFRWQAPMLDGIPGAWCTAGVQSCFANTTRCQRGTGNKPEAQALAHKMATVWANFASMGNPSQHGLPRQPTDPESNQTTFFDTECRMAADREGEARTILWS